MDMILREQLFIALILLSIFIAYKTAWKYHWSAFLLLAGTLISAVLIFQEPQMSVDLLSLRLRLVSARSFCLITALVFFVHSLSKKGVNHLLTALEFLAVIDTILVLIFGFGFFNASSADMTFVAMVYPSILFKERKIISKWHYWVITLAGILPIIAIIKIQGATPIVCLGLSIFAYFWAKNKAKSAAILGLTSVSIGCLLRWYLHPETDLFMHSDRTGQWFTIMNWWETNANPLIGTGTGTFQWLGPISQVEAKTVGPVSDLFLQMHSEYLQVLFEQGIIGLVLLVILSSVCLKKSFKTPWLFSCVVSTLFAFATQFPIRYVLGQLFILVLIRICFEGEETCPKI